MKRLIAFVLLAALVAESAPYGQIDTNSLIGSYNIPVSNGGTGATDATAARGNLGLGTAATTAATDYATAAQGSSATAAYAASVTNATSANTASAIVKRDASGNFAAGTMTGSATQLGGVAAANYAQKLTANTTINIETTKKSTKYLDNASSVDASKNFTDLPCTTHSFAIGDPIKIYDGPAPAFNDDNYTVDTGSTTDTIRIEAAYVSAAFGADSTSVYYRQPTTAAEINALIAAQPKNLGGYTLTYQYLEGRYEANSSIIWPNSETGTLVVQGNSADNSMAERKRVVINSASTTALSFSNCDAVLTVQHLGVIGVGGVSSAAAIKIIGATRGGSTVNYCSMRLLGNGSGLYCSSGSLVGSYSNYFSGGGYGIRVLANSNITAGAGASNPTARPSAGITSDASLVFKVTGATQPEAADSANNEIKLNGGQIY